MEPTIYLASSVRLQFVGPKGGFIMGMEWYDAIAKKNGGYKSNAIYSVEGLSGEDVFEERLIKMLGDYDSVLDAGCGHGEFTIRMAKYAKNIIGFDNSRELLTIARSLLEESHAQNVQFVYALTKGENPLPFEDGQFDLIYDRRGPTSIIDHGRILRSGGVIFGIHSAAMEKVQERLHNNGFIHIEIDEFNEAIMVFSNATEFTKALSAIPGNPDYSLSEYAAELQKKINESKINGRLAIKQWRYIWRAVKP